MLRLLAGLCKGIVATAAMFLSTSYGPGAVAVASQDPFYGIAHARLIAIAQEAGRRRWTPAPAAAARPKAQATSRYRPPEPLENDGKVRAGELLAALSKD